MRCLIAISFAVALAGVVTCLTYPSQVSTLKENLDLCVRQSRASIECIGNIRDVKERVFGKINEIKEVKQTLEEMRGVLPRIHDGEWEVEKFAGPEFQGRLQWLRDTVLALQGTFDDGHARAKAIFDKMIEWQPRLESSISNSERVLNMLNTVHQKCSAKQQAAVDIRNCFQKNTDDSIKQEMEKFAGAVNVKLSVVNQRMVEAGEFCTQIKERVDVFKTELGIREPLVNVQETLEKVGEFLDEVKDTLKHKICRSESGETERPTGLSGLSGLLTKGVYGQEEETGKDCISIKDILEKPEVVSTKMVTLARRAVAHVMEEFPDLNLNIPTLSKLYTIDVNGAIPMMKPPTGMDIELFSNDCISKAKEACQTGNPSLLVECSSTPDVTANVDPLVSAVRALREFQPNLKNDGYGSTTPNYQLFTDTDFVTQPTPYGTTYPNGEYPDGEYPNGEYPNGEYPNGEYPNGEHPNGEYPNGEYPNGEYPNGEHPNGEHPNGEHSNGEHPNGEYPGQEYPSPYPGMESDLQQLVVSMHEMKDMISYLNEEQLEQFMSGLGRLLLVLPHQKAQVVVETLYHVIVSEVHHNFHLDGKFYPDTKNTDFFGGENTGYSGFENTGHVEGGNTGHVEGGNTFYPGDKTTVESTFTGETGFAARSLSDQAAGPADTTTPTTSTRRPTSTSPSTPTTPRINTIPTAPYTPRPGDFAPPPTPSPNAAVSRYIKQLIAEMKRNSA